MHRLFPLLILALSACSGSAPHTPATGSIAGIVKDPAGAPVAGAGISTAPATAATQSDSSGAWTLAGLSPGEYAVRAEKLDFEPAEVPGVRVVAGKTVSVNLVLAPVKILPTTGSIAGTVAEAVTGKPIPQATLTLSPGSLQTTSDPAGAFDFEKVAAGPYQIAATAKGFQDGQPVSVVVESQKQTRVALTLAPLDVPVSSCVSCHSDLDRIQADLAANPPPVPPGGVDLGEC